MNRSGMIHAPNYVRCLVNALGGGTQRLEGLNHESGHPSDLRSYRSTCSCGNVIKTRSTLCKPIHLDVCSECHPFYTGKQKVLDTGGRIDRFKQRFGVFGATK